MWPKQNDPAQPGTKDPADPILGQNSPNDGYQPNVSSDPTAAPPPPGSMPAQGPDQEQYQTASHMPQPVSNWEQSGPVYPSAANEQSHKTQPSLYPQPDTSLEHSNPFGPAPGSQQPYQTQPASVYPEPMSYNSPPPQNQPGMTPSNAAVPQKYRVFRAVGDTFRAAKNNFLTLTITVVLSYLIAIVTIVPVGLIILTTLGFGGIAFATASKIITAIIFGLILYTVWYALAYAYVLGVSATSIYEGAEKRKTSIKATLVRGLKSIKRIAVANVLILVILWWPLVVVTLLSLALVFGHRSSGGSQAGLTIISLFGGLAAVIWVIIGSMRYSLVPYVALFESDLPISKVLSRSKYLMSKGGQWFVLKGSMLLLLIILVLSALTGTKPQEINSSKNLVVNFISILLTIITNGVLVMLYRNRRAVKG